MNNALTIALAATLPGCLESAAAAPQAMPTATPSMVNIDE